MSVLVQFKMVVVGKVFAKANFSPVNLISQAKLGLYWDLPSSGSCLSTGSADSLERLGSCTVATLCGGICKHFHRLPHSAKVGDNNEVTFWSLWHLRALMSEKRQRPLDHSFTKASSQFKAVLQLKSPAPLPSPHIPPTHPTAAHPIHTPIQVPGLLPTELIQVKTNLSMQGVLPSTNSAATHFTM